MIQLDSPDTGITVFVYNSVGNLVSATDAKGQQTNYIYDAGNRLLTVDRDRWDYNEIYTYDNCLNGNGLLCFVSNQLGETVSIVYDGRGPVIQMTTNYGSFRYEYDTIGTVMCLTHLVESFLYL